MNIIKVVGRGMIYGLKHPFTETTPERWQKMTLSESILDSFGMSIVQTTISCGLAFGVVCGIGYINSRINKAPIKVKMVVEDEKKKK